MSAQRIPRFDAHSPFPMPQGLPASLHSPAPAPHQFATPTQLLAVSDAMPGSCAVVLDLHFVVMGGTERWFRQHSLRRSESIGTRLRTLLPTPEMAERLEICQQSRPNGESIVMRGVRDGVHEIILCMPAIEGDQERLVWLEQLSAGAPLGDAHQRTFYPVRHTWGVLAALTMKQLDVMRLVGMGLENERIAQIQGVSRRTTEWHMRSIYEALGVDGRAELARLSLRAGLPSFPLDAWERMLRGRDHDRACEAFARARNARDD